MKYQIKFIYLFLIIIFIGHNCAANSERVQAKADKKAQKIAKAEQKKAEKNAKKDAKKSKRNKKQNNTTIKAPTKKTKTNHVAQNYEALIEANIEAISELEAKINYLEENLAFYQAGNSAEFSSNNSIFNKKIILNNGSSIFGKIVFQDDYIIQVETIIGTLTIDKNSVIRVVDFQMSQLDTNQDMINLNVVQNATSNQNTENQFLNSAKVILLGEFLETKDENNNTLLSGEVKNIGVKRADFVKITFTIFKDGNYNSSTAEYTAFVNGSEVVFDGRISSNSSLYSHETGSFSVVIPNDFGPFLSYSYVIDWEQYE